ncbi:hypothetical protein [Secundilactobacillus muriivasis]
MSRVRIISSADYGPVFPMELKVYRDLEKYFDEQKRKERRAKQNRHGTFSLENKEEPLWISEKH